MSFNPRQDIGSPSFVYDKIYNSYQEMISSQQRDGIAIGRYVLILYKRIAITNGDTVIGYQVIPPQDSSEQYMDTAIFQKQYNSEAGEHYEFITYMGIFGDTPPLQKSIIMVDEDKKFIYNNQENDDWIGIESENNNLFLTHKLITSTSKINSYPTHKPTIDLDSSTGGAVFYFPEFKIDEKGHMVYVQQGSGQGVSGLVPLKVAKWGSEQ